MSEPKKLQIACNLWIAADEIDSVSIGKGTLNLTMRGGSTVAVADEYISGVWSYLENRC